ncbi:MAG: type I-B CRISPR-associated protein Cas5b [Hyphomicrobiales bacterium]
MNLYRIKISSWTSSFRYPNLISGFQPTLEVPPLSTILGLINAASGYYIPHNNLKIGYYFKYDMKGVDLESIYQIEGNKTGNFPLNKAKTNIINREFLYSCKLYLYLEDKQYADYLSNPYYSLVLGRSNDLATVEEIKSVDLQEVHDAKISGQIIPFTNNFLPGDIQALPKYFTDSIPRNNLGTEPYSVISCNTNIQSMGLTAYKDSSIGSEGVDIYMHQLNFD